MPSTAQNTSASAKAGAFEVSRLFVADKAARDEAQKEFAAATKDVEFLGQVGYTAAAVKVSKIGGNALVASPLDYIVLSTHADIRLSLPRRTPLPVRPLLLPSPLFARTVLVSTLSPTSSTSLRAVFSTLSSRLSPTRRRMSPPLPLPPSRPSSRSSTHGVPPFSFPP